VPSGRVERLRTKGPVLEQRRRDAAAHIIAVYPRLWPCRAAGALAPIEPHAGQDSGRLVQRCDIAACQRSVGNSPLQWPPTTSSVYSNCSHKCSMNRWIYQTAKRSSAGAQFALRKSPPQPKSRSLRNPEPASIRHFSRAAIAGIFGLLCCLPPVLGTSDRPEAGYLGRLLLG
jgi:hypothetical protein